MVYSGVQMISVLAPCLPTRPDATAAAAMVLAQCMVELGEDKASECAVALRDLLLSDRCVGHVIAAQGGATLMHVLHAFEVGAAAQAATQATIGPRRHLIRCLVGRLLPRLPTRADAPALLDRILLPTCNRLLAALREQQQQQQQQQQEQGRGYGHLLESLQALEETIIFDTEALSVACGEVPPMPELVSSLVEVWQLLLAIDTHVGGPAAAVAFREFQQQQQQQQQQSQYRGEEISTVVWDGLGRCVATAARTGALRSARSAGGDTASPFARALVVATDIAAQLVHRFDALPFPCHLDAMKELLIGCIIDPEADGGGTAEGEGGDGAFPLAVAQSAVRMIVTAFTRVWSAAKAVVAQLEQLEQQQAGGAETRAAGAAGAAATAAAAAAGDAEGILSIAASAFSLLNTAMDACPALLVGDVTVGVGGGQTSSSPLALFTVEVAGACLALPLAGWESREALRHMTRFLSRVVEAPPEPWARDEIWNAAGASAGGMAVGAAAGDGGGGGLKAMYAVCQAILGQVTFETATRGRNSGGGGIGALNRAQGVSAKALVDLLYDMLHGARSSSSSSGGGGSSSSSSSGSETGLRPLVRAALQGLIEGEAAAGPSAALTLSGLFAPPNSDSDDGMKGALGARARRRGLRSRGRGASGGVGSASSTNHRRRFCALVFDRGLVLTGQMALAPFLQSVSAALPHHHHQQQQQQQQQQGLFLGGEAEKGGEDEDEDAIDIVGD